jgi:ubiquitin carboxyl-terminal hydrolase 4/11
MSGGHYTAYAKNPIKDLWFEFNDSHVSRANMSEIVSSAAYCLFYRLRD